MKKLTQEIFNSPNCPDYIVAAELDGRGNAWGTTIRHGESNRGTRLTRPIIIGRGYDTTDWQNCLINREDNNSINEH